MADHNREELIEKAREAIHGAIPGSGEYESWKSAKDEGFDFLGDIARAALEVFEQAHTPTSDEREALAQVIFERSHTPDDALNLWDGDINKLVDAILAAGFRHPEVPSADLDDELVRERDHHGIDPEPQGEPTDEAIHAAMEAQKAFLNPDGRAAMRAAMRAAAAVREEERGQ